MAAFALTLGSFAACGSSEPAPSESDIWLNPFVGEECEDLERIRNDESPYADQLPRAFPLPEGAETVGWTRAGKREVVRATAPGSFRVTADFFKKQLVKRGWSNGDASEGGDPSGQYARVQLNEGGYEGTVRVISCPDEVPEILVEFARRPRS